MSMAFVSVEENLSLRLLGGDSDQPKSAPILGTATPAAIVVGDNLFNVSSLKGWQDTGCLSKLGTS
jgi:hypothetical protein